MALMTLMQIDVLGRNNAELSKNIYAIKIN